MENKNFENRLKELSIYLEENILEDFFYELWNSKEMIREIEQAVENEKYFETKQFETILEFRFYRIIIFILIRSLKPNSIIETGVLHGLTTKFIIQALKRNNYGMLYSIDEPSYFGNPPANNDGFIANLPPNKEPGWVLSKEDKKLWNLILGKSITKLPLLFDQIKECDFFIHDSEHTYETMWFELNFAWENLSDGGILLCDNISSNTSFFDFCNKIGKLPFLFSHDLQDKNSEIRFGIVKKC